VLDDGEVLEASQAEVDMRQPPRLPDVRYGGWQGQAQQQQQAGEHGFVKPRARSVEGRSVRPR
jgi:hypothetical protein